MALLPYRTESINGAEVNTDYFMNGTGEAGYFVVNVTTTSGVGSSFDDTNSAVALPTMTNGTNGTAVEHPVGFLLMDVVNKDLAHTHLNQHKREGQIGGKVAILRKGIVVTNALAAGAAPAPGDPACFTVGGVLNTTQTTGSSNPGSALYFVNNRIGTFLSSRSSDGYAKVSVNII